MLRSESPELGAAAGLTIGGLFFILVMKRPCYNNAAVKSRKDESIQERNTTSKLKVTV
jgi:hypothetical protein